MTAAQKIRKCAESYFAVIRETVQENSMQRDKESVPNNFLFIEILLSQ